MVGNVQMTFAQNHALFQGVSDGEANDSLSFASILQAIPFPKTRKTSGSEQPSDPMLLDLLNLLASFANTAQKQDLPLPHATGEAETSLPHSRVNDHPVFASMLNLVNNLTETQKRDLFRLLNNYDRNGQNLTVDAKTVLQSFQMREGAPHEVDDKKLRELLRIWIQEGVQDEKDQLNTHIANPSLPTAQLSKRVPMIVPQQLVQETVFQPREETSTDPSISMKSEMRAVNDSRSVSLVGHDLPEQNVHKSDSSIHARIIPEGILFGHVENGPFIKIDNSKMEIYQVNASRFDTDFSSHLIKRAELIQKDGVSTYKVTLIPQGLGEIHVQVTKNADSQLTLLLSADSPAAKHLLDTHLVAMRTQLEQQGIPVNEVKVVPSSQFHLGTDSGMFQQRGQREREDALPGRVQRRSYAIEGAEYETMVTSNITHVSNSGNSGIDYIA
jgi:flagellar hook-length control protein FliK